MQKYELATYFFEQLVQGGSDYINRMIELELDAPLLELFNKLSEQIYQGDVDKNRFQASLLIIGYLIRAHEYTVQSQFTVVPLEGPLN